MSEHASIRAICKYDMKIVRCACDETQIGAPTPFPVQEKPHTMCSLKNHTIIRNGNVGLHHATWNTQCIPAYNVREGVWKYIQMDR